MRFSLAVAIGALVALGGCASRRTSARVVSYRAPAPPTRVVSRRVIPAPAPTVATPAVTRHVVPRTVATSTARPTPPSPPSMELMRNRRSATASRRSAGSSRVVPVSRTRVQPAVAAPPVRPRAPAATPVDVRGLFATNARAPAAPDPCAGGT